MEIFMSVKLLTIVIYVFDAKVECCSDLSCSIMVSNVIIHWHLLVGTVMNGAVLNRTALIL